MEDRCLPNSYTTSNDIVYLAPSNEPSLLCFYFLFVENLLVHTCRGSLLIEDLITRKQILINYLGGTGGSSLK